MIMTDTTLVPALEFIFSAHVTVDPALDLGDVGKGGRRIVPIAGGNFSGPQLRGQVLPGGADWQVLRSDGTAELEARYTLRTDDGVLIYVRNHATAPRSAGRHRRARGRAAGRSGALLLPRRDVLRNRRCSLRVAY